MDLLRFITAGSVDDGKSTLIGRLLYDSKSIFEDQLEAIEKNARGNNGQINLALLTDGLKAEREQGITIDVAYKYFSTPKRKFIIADAPGHVQYTRNMVTGASNSNLAIILIDARKGVIEQTYRHSYIASMLRIPHLVVCINKMDLVEFSQTLYEEIKAEYLNFASRLDIKDIEFIPISALNGDNVVDKSENLSWYDGRTLLNHLEEVYIESDENIEDARFPVQYVIRPLSDEHHDYRGYAGQVRSGIFRKGDSITVLPSGFTSTIESIDTYDGEVEEAFPPMSVTIRLKDEIDISRGDMIVLSESLPIVSQDLEANICWMDSKALLSGNKYILRQTTNAVKAIVKEVEFKVAPDTHEKLDASKGLTLNEIGKIKIRTAKPVSFDEYRINRSTGSFILVDEGTNSTVGAGMITGVGA
ncbi:sulfate adenylyltransferase subunit 1 [Leptospira noguchii]|uniref:sulfate adenylyltransferase n=1 Tax=Leptospira noguchii serovar Autumnalis str. ZUN142 TaxID=1085540 RepID=M6UHR8_9LEPT|nr:GTP-binding protein [Leptospira noguchii]EMO40614.1 sulfate adenylyltransferase, large subunit [Leptospira noguchii serovar Autumnalis str. ZUN142]EMS87247.1 sulfate adenylyltransferase, large subunit [Leptospira noguchii str. Hook]UOG34131.1 GTP-binding protein [Leptospira noguchii]UOG37707.1 GTP-binding protein [Leptospira noguchii]UOG41448.1 GTP-binding protein [Leptospira noguchii]